MTEQTAAAFLSRSEVDDRVGIITLNRPEKLNAVNGALATALGGALEQVEHDASYSVVIITGSGRAFCAGADLKAIDDGEAITADGHPEWGLAGMIGQPFSKPIIAAVNGLAYGGGFEIVLGCDLVVMSEEAVLCLSEVTKGLIAGGGGAVRLPRQVPLKVAMEMVLTGLPISAGQALHHGLVNRVVPPAALMDSALELARVIASNAPLALAASKRLVYASSGVAAPWDAAVWRLNDQLLDEVVLSDDVREGRQAFLEKRAPHWTGQ